MNVHDVGRLSLGQWVAICQGWARAHGKSRVKAPTEDEFDKAVMKARGIHGD